MNRPYRYATTIHPVRFIPKLFSPLEIRCITRYSKMRSPLSNRAGLKRRRWTFYEAINIRYSSVASVRSVVNAFWLRLCRYFFIRGAG